MRRAGTTLAACGFVALVVLAGDRLAAQGEAPREAADAEVLPATWRVATRQVPPFAFRGDDGAWQGLSIELWNGVADDLGFATEYVEAELDGMIDGVAGGRFDAAVGALTVTAQREERVDFTQPFYSGGLGIAAAERPRGDFVAVARRLLSPAFWRVVAGLGCLLLVAGFLVWIFERRRNAQQFGGSAAHGIGAGFWWAAVTMTTVGYGDKAPVSVPGRILALVWMFTSLIVISAFTAAITSALTVGQLAAAVSGPEDLPAVRVASLDGSTGAAWLDAAGIGYIPYPSVPAALAALADDRLDALVYDQPILQHLVQEHYTNRLAVLPQVLEDELYAFALPSGSPHREAIDRALLRRVGTDTWQERLDLYLEE